MYVCHNYYYYYYYYYHYYYCYYYHLLTIRIEPSHHQALLGCVTTVYTVLCVCVHSYI